MALKAEDDIVWRFFTPSLSICDTLSAKNLKLSWPKRIIECGDDTLIVLAADGNIFTINENTIKDLSCLSKETVVDFCKCPRRYDMIIVIISSGQALLINWINDIIEGSIDDLKEQPSGSPARGVRMAASFRQCSSGSDHLILIDKHGQAWSWGEGPQIGLVENNSKRRSMSGVQSDKISLTRIDFFQGLKIVNIVSGNDFNLALVEHSPDKSSANSSPASDKSHSPILDGMACPLGLVVESKSPLKPSSETDDYQMTEEVELRKKTSKNDSEKNEESKDNHVERLAQSGLYINPSDALKYLSDQLSWIGKPVAAPMESQILSDETDRAALDMTLAKQPDQISTSAAGHVASGVSSLYKGASSVVAGSVKYVGQTVSRLSYSFSSTEKEPEILANLPDAPHELVSLSELEKKKQDEPSLLINKKSEIAKDKKNISSAPSMHRRSQSASMIDRLGRQHFDCKSESQNVKLPKYEVWFWGRGNLGQAGQGDTLDRLQPCVIDSLTETLVQKVICSNRHCLALTLSGKVYGWGDNSHGQASPKCKTKVCSQPTLISLPVGETACDIAVTHESTFILTDRGTLFQLNRTLVLEEVKLVPPQNMKNFVIPKFLMGGQSFVGVGFGVADLPVCCLKSVEKIFLGRVQEVLKRVMEPLCGHDLGKATNAKSSARKQLQQSLENFVHVLSASILSSASITVLDKASQLTVLRYPAVLEESFLEHSKCVSNCLVGEFLALDNQEFVRLSDVIIEILQKLFHMDTMNLGHDALMPKLVSTLLSEVGEYVLCLKTMLAAGRKQKKIGIIRLCETIEKSLILFKNLEKAIEKEKRIVTRTIAFWENNSTNTKLNSLRSYDRRVLLDSKEIPVNVANSGSFHKNWLILMNDLLVHVCSSTVIPHPLQTIWIDSHQEGKSSEINLLMPEETMTLVANAENKTDWLNALQKAILDSLSAEKTSVNNNRFSVSSSYTPPIIRSTSYTFKKLTDLKGAHYVGAWMHGRMHGDGSLVWPDGKTYDGQLRQNQRHGEGKLIVKSKQGNIVFEGQWKNDQLEGRGKIINPNGDIYEGMLKDGKPHGQGIHKHGRFMGEGASIYIGEWSQGVRQGYGVSDDIVSGEKYMGMWNGDMKSGPGCVVTVDGVYYEGTFAHNKMSGKGLMLFDDDTSYIGNFADAGVFSGQGVLTYENGDHLDGSFYGNYTDGMKFSGTIFKSNKILKPNANVVTQNTVLNKEKIGTYSVDAKAKWTAIFSHYHSLLSLPDITSHINYDTSENASKYTQIAWEQIAILINQSKNSAKAKDPGILSSRSKIGIDLMDGLEMIPDYNNTNLNEVYLREIHSYLKKAFASPLHPLYEVLNHVSDCFNATYGGVRLHPRLLKHAVEELDSLVSRLYMIVRYLFPALPPPGCKELIHSSADGQDHMVSPRSLIHPYILPLIHSSIFMLYALYYKKNDDEYWIRILKWNKHPDIALLSFLDVDQKFWKLNSQRELISPENASIRNSISQMRDCHFVKAIETLQQIKTGFTPFEKLSVILETFREVNKIGFEICGPEHTWSMDSLFPVFQYIVVRARILQLGAEIHLIEDLMESYLHSGEYGIMFTTLQASYFQILKESVFLT